MAVLRLLLYPFSLVFGIIVLVRNFLYDTAILPSVRFDVPVILVGNLSTGGSGKTPHVEFLVQLLSKQYKVATLSRGYGRKTKGFREVDLHSSVWEAGDEPLLYKTRHPELTVAVCENRAEGIRTILKRYPDVDVFVMDDGFQHRRVRPGFSILLTPWQSPFFNDQLLPSGNLREPRSGRHRADCVVVSRTPASAAAQELRQFSRRIALKNDRPVYFSSITYGHPLPVFQDTALPFPTGSVRPLVFAGIADAGSFTDYIKSKFGEPDILLFGDHHDYTEKELEDLFERYQGRMLTDQNAVLLTTEKDAMRLRTGPAPGALKQLPLFYIPIDVVLHPAEKTLENSILDYVAKNKRNR